MMSLRQKLINIIYRIATGNKKVKILLTPIGPIFVFTLIGVLIIISLQMDKFLKLPKLLPASLNIIVSAPILAIGLFLMVWSNLHFLKAKGTPVPLNPPPKLVTTGPYAYVRNPMVTGGFIILFGLGILLNSVSLTFIFTPILILLAVLELKIIEEPELEKRLGKEYIEYKKRIPMFIPEASLPLWKRGDEKNL